MGKISPGDIIWVVEGKNRQDCDITGYMAVAETGEYVVANACYNKYEEMRDEMIGETLEIGWCEGLYVFPHSRVFRGRKDAEKYCEKPKEEK